MNGISTLSKVEAREYFQGYFQRFLLFKGTFNTFFSSNKFYVIICLLYYNIDKTIYMAEKKHIKIFVIYGDL